MKMINYFCADLFVDTLSNTYELISVKTGLENVEREISINALLKGISFSKWFLKFESVTIINYKDNISWNSERVIIIYYKYTGLSIIHLPWLSLYDVIDIAPLWYQINVIMFVCSRFWCVLGKTTWAAYVFSHIG